MPLFNRSRPATFLNTQVVGQAGVIASSLRIAHGRVAGLDAAPHASDLILDLGGAFVFPGLINAHDHLELNSFPRLKWRDHYVNAQEWIADFQPRFETDPILLAARSAPREDRFLLGGVKNLLSGVTTVCHHDPLHPLLRGRGFPIRVVTHYRYNHSLLMDGETVVREYRRTPKDWPWIIHAAEGTDAEAAAELERLDRLGCLGPNTLLVHGVGLSAQDRSRLIERGGGLIWCPASNEFLLGATAEVRDLARAGRVALGSDSRLSGERDLLSEMKCAAATNQVDAQTLFHLVTVNAASLLRLAQAGRVASGFPADLLVLPRLADDPYRTLLAAVRKDVLLVTLGGKPWLGTPNFAAIFSACGVQTQPVKIDGTVKLLAQTLVHRLQKCWIAEPGLECVP